MASLNSLLGSRNFEIEEENLEKGRIYVFQPTAQGHPMCCGPRFCAPSNGIAVIEIWGAGGSSGKQCCCATGGFGGNSGAFAKKTVTLSTGAMICGWLGESCRNAGDLCFKGCSEGTCIIYDMDCCGNCNSGYGCMCAEGGFGGVALCVNACPAVCCFAQCFCVTETGAGCGIVCNVCKDGSGRVAQAYGGDVNCPGRASCVTYYSNLPWDYCSRSYSMATPYGMYSNQGGMAIHGSEACNSFAQVSGSTLMQSISAMNGLSRSPGSGGFMTSCWNGTRVCGCYNKQACHYFVPYGVGAPPGQPCCCVRDHGYRGGPSLMRVKWIES